MIETDEQIQQVVQLAGELLEFSFGGIYGIPTTDVYSVQGLNSPYDIEKQDISFKIAYSDFYENVIVVKDTFIYMLGRSTCTFEIVSHIHDFQGWVDLKVKLLTMED